MVPFPDPEGVTVHHVWLLEAVQLVFEVTENEVLPDEAVTFWFAGVTFNAGETPFWVTVTTAGVNPETVTVMLATR